MRHRKKLNHLSRKSPHRKAMLANMATSLIVHKRITTTTAKAKALRIFVEPLITRSKEDSTHSRRMVFKYLRDKDAVSELFRDVAAKVGERPGGYTRIIKIEPRQGDNAEMCIIELVDYNENLLADKAAAKSKPSRRRRSGKKKTEGELVTEDQVGEVDETTDDTAGDTVTAEVKEEEPVAEAKEEEPAAEVKEEEPAAEVKEEEPAAEVKEEEPAAEVKEEEPAAEVKEEAPAAEVKKEEPVAEAKEEEPAAEAKEEEDKKDKKDETEKES